jgi:hypothetical protein
MVSDASILQPGMKRGTVVLLALAILLAHTFAIHQTPDGDFAEAYEIAHVAYRIGRNLVYEGEALWNPGGPPAESYPSVAWVLASALAARLYSSPIGLTQVLGLCSALATLVALAQFSSKRTSGLIAPVLLASSGSAAAAALSGTEAAFAMLLTTASFLAFERGWARTLALSLSLLVLTRPEALAVLVLLMVCARLWRPEGAPVRWSAFGLPLGVVLATVATRRALTQSWLSPFAAPLLELEPERWRIGLEYLAGFAISSGFGLLILAVILSVCAARISAMGARALAVAVLWSGVVALSGGDGLPFWNALVPALPLFFLGVQDGLRAWMDERPTLERVIWPLLLVSLGGAFLASKVPGDLGPLRLEEPLTRWQTPRGELARVHPRSHGRLGLLEEIRAVEHLRRLGVYLRDRVGADAVILTYWPGAIGYLSRKEVRDLSGRAWPLPGQARPLSWRGASRVDLVASLASDVDYVVPLIGTLSESDAPTDFLHGWLERYDTVGPTEKRVREMLRVLGGFRLVCVPVPAESRRPDEPSEHPFPLLQRKELAQIPTLAVERGEDVVRVLVRHEGHEQVVDLCVRATTSDGRELYLSPTGSWASSGAIDARTSLLVFATGARSIQLLEARVTSEVRGAKLTAWLHNPGMHPNAPLSAVGLPVTAGL